MRILFVHSGSDLYGASRSLLRLSTRLVKDGHSVLAVLPDEGALAPALSLAGVTVRVHGRMPVVTRSGVRSLRGLFSLFVNLPVSIYQLSRWVLDFKADVIHTNTALILSPGWAARLTGRPHIWHVREFFAEFGPLWRVYQWYMAILADLIICVSTPVAAQYDEGIRTHKVRVIHNGFPAAEFQPVPSEEVLQFKKQFGLQDETLAGIVGRIKYGRKGQEVYVRAASLLKERFPEVRFLLIGSPFPGNESHLENLQKLISSLDLGERVIYTGDVKNIQAAYAALDICVLASALPEPFGGVVIEAMAMGKPVVGTAHGGTLEQIENEVTGLLVPPDDPARLAEAMVKLLADADLRQRMGQAGRERFYRLFEFERFYAIMITTYTDIISGKPLTKRLATP